MTFINSMFILARITTILLQKIFIIFCWNSLPIKQELRILSSSHGNHHSPSVSVNLATHGTLSA